MVKIRLTRFGKHNAPFFRIVAIDSRVKRDGGYISLIGTYLPGTSVKPKDIKINEELCIQWLNNGAQPSETVLNILKEKGVYKKYLEQKKHK